MARDKATGKLTAIQAKYYKDEVGKDTINSFIAEASKDYYTDGIIVSTTDKWNKNAKQALEGLSKPTTRIGLSQLQNVDVNWELFDFDHENKDLGKKPKSYGITKLRPLKNRLHTLKIMIVVS